MSQPDPGLVRDPADLAATRSLDSQPDTTTFFCADASAGDCARFPGAAGRYRLLGEIARGGMGVVYRAADAALGREVAVKVLQERFVPSSSAASRFVKEATITGKLQHPGIPPVHDVGALPDGRPFLAMKLIKGHTLDSLLRARPDPTADRGRFLAAFEQICQAVACAHNRHILHRDLKPANVMMGAFGEVQVMDWGLAKVLTSAEGQQPEEGNPDGQTATEALSLCDSAEWDETQDGSVLGTPAFMPPEQAIGAVEQIDRRSDVFGLGAILAVVLTGKPPFVADGDENVRAQAAGGKLGACYARLDACGADPELVALAKRCLAPERADRPADGEAVAEAVQALRAAAEERARQAEVERARAEGDRATAQAEAREQRNLRRAQMAWVTAIGLLLAAGGVVAWWESTQAAARKADEADRMGRNAQALSTLVEQCEKALRTEDAESAGAAIAEVDRRLPDGGGTEVAERLERCRANLALLQELDRIDLFRWTPRGGSVPDWNAVAAKWRAAFDRFGAAPGSGSPSETARRVNESLLQRRLLATLDLWLATDPSAAVRVMLSAADADPYREAVRDAMLARDGARLAELAERAEALVQLPGFAAALGQHPGVPVERQRTVLEVALRSSPGTLPLLMALGTSYMDNQRKDADERVRWYQAAVSAHPSCTAARNNLGVSLRDKGDQDGAIACFREVIRRDPNDTHARNNLGVTLWDKGDLDAAIAEYQDAIRVDPKYAFPHYNLGNAVREKGELDRAVSEYKEAIRLGLTHPRVTNNLRQTELWLELLPRLSDVVVHPTAPGTPAQTAEFAMLCGQPFQRRYVAATRLYEQAFEADPALAMGDRYSAACFAALAAAGKGADSASLSSADRAGLHARALDWLRAELAQSRQVLASRVPGDRRALALTLAHWLKDPDLASVRPGLARVGMPAAERAAWDVLWAEVQATLTAAQQPPLQ